MTRTHLLSLLDQYEGRWRVIKNWYFRNKRLVYVHETMLPAMVRMVKEGDENNFEKANRWLGFVQGVFWSEGLNTIDEMREHNRQ